MRREDKARIFQNLKEIRELEAGLAGSREIKQIASILEEIMLEIDAIEDKMESDE